MLNWKNALVAVATVLVTAFSASAQINPGHLTGSVKDAQGAVLPGVTVTATSPALLGAQTVVTEANGDYRFPNLPAGTYTVSYELTGFQTLKREGIQLTQGQTLNLDITLQLATLQESVTVTSESPVVDTQSTAVGYVQTTAQLVGVPTSTDLWGALAQTPGVRMQGVDVGGSHKSQQSGYEAFGITNQARVFTDGVDTTEGSGGAGFYQDYFAQSEVAVQAAGGDVAMNTPGAAIISTIKSGGNQFKGLENIVYEGEKMVGNNVDSATQNRSFTGNPNLKFWEAHLELGGPVVPDKLWFYAAYNHFKIDKVISGIPQSLATDLGIFNNFTTKESYKASQKDTVIGYYQWGKKNKPLRGLSALTPPESALAQQSPSWAFNGRWQRVWSNRLFSEVNVGNFGYVFPEQPNVDFTTHPPRHDNGTGADSGAGWINAGGSTGPFVLARQKPQIYSTFTYFLPTGAGSHDFKGGFEWLIDKSTNAANGTAGPILYLDLNGKPDQVRLTDYGTASGYGTDWVQGSDFNRRTALYFQDRWNATPKVTLTLGVRYDHQVPYYGDAVRKPILTQIFQPQTVTKASLWTTDNIAPRIGVSFDPESNGKSVIKAFYGRFYFNLADTLAGLNPAGANYKDYRFNDLNGNGLYDGTQELGAVTNSFGGTSTTLDPNFKLSHTDEFDLSFDKQFWGESSARIAYVRKMSRDQYATINVNRLNQFVIPTVVPVTIRSYDGGIVGVQNYTVNDITAATRALGSKNVIMNMPNGEGDWNYDTMSLAFTKRFAQGLFLNASYDYQWRKDRRNPATTSSSPLNSDPIGTQTSGTYAFLPYTTAVLQSTTTWATHLQARYEFKYQIGVAVNYSGQSGWPYARVISASLPNAGTVSIFDQDLSNNRADAVHLMAFRVDKAFTINKIKMMAMFDLFNALNTNAVTNFTVINGANYNRINAVVDPRTAQVGFRVEF